MPRTLPEATKTLGIVRKSTFSSISPIFRLSLAHTQRAFGISRWTRDTVKIFTVTYDRTCDGTWNICLNTKSLSPHHAPCGGINHLLDTRSNCSVLSIGILWCGDKTLREHAQLLYDASVSESRLISSCWMEAIISQCVLQSLEFHYIRWYLFLRCEKCLIFSTGHVKMTPGRTSIQHLVAIFKSKFTHVS